MYTIDGIAYAGEPELAIKVVGVRPLEGHRLWLRFNTGEAKIYNLSPMLSSPAFSSLMDETIFRDVYIDYGVTVWKDGSIDISPEILYHDGILVQDPLSA